MNASTRRVIVEAGGEKFNEADSLRWKRVFIIGFPKDEKCNRLTDIQELRLANDDDEDGISIRCEISKAENLSAYNM